MLQRIGAVALGVGLLCGCPAANAQPAEKKYHAWWNDRHIGRPLNSPNARKLPQISVKGNKFVDPQGNTILFRGLSISDPDKIEHQGRWNKELFLKVKDTGAMIVRVPVHPIAWRERTPQEYLKLLDQAVEWCTDLGMYVTVDWHSIGNLETGLFQDPMYDTSKTETFDFWRTIARHYAHNNTVAFYELFNEPTVYRNQLGPATWEQWKKINEDLITLVRAYDTETIPLVATFDWAYDLTPLNLDPVRAEGIGYVTHPYPHKRSKPWPPKWEEDFGFAAAQYPIVATEIGFVLGKGTMAENGDYGVEIVKYLESKGISWMCWVFDPEWGPPMIKSWDSFELTESGKFWVEALHGNVK